MLKAKLMFVCTLGFFTAVHAEKSIILQSFPGTFINVAAEGNWTFKQGGDFYADTDDLGILLGTKVYNEPGFRVSAGVQKYLCPNFSIVADAGYGFYGRTSFFFNIAAPPVDVDPTFFNLDDASLNVSNDGFDVVAGLSYDILKGVDLSLKVGAMLEHSRNTLNLAPLGASLWGRDFNRTQLLPELKFGGSIKFCKDIYLTAAYMHVFGSRPIEVIDIDILTPTGSINVIRESTTLDTLSIGIKWNITEIC